MSSPTGSPAPAPLPTDPTAPAADLARAARAHRLAWWSLALYPVSFAAAFVIGEGLASLLGYPSGEGETPPFWVMLTAATPAVLVFVVPGVVAVLLSRRARSLGRTGRSAPAIIGVTVAAAFLAQNALGYLAQVVLG